MKKDGKAWLWSRLFTIPEEIKQFKPFPCTEVKEINGHYYVYTYSAKQLPSGKWGKQSRKCIGKIIPETGFVPNRNFLSNADDDLFSVLEYGQYTFLSQIPIIPNVTVNRVFESSFTEN